MTSHHPARANVSDRSLSKALHPWVMLLAVLVPAALSPKPGEESNIRVVLHLVIATLIVTQVGGQRRKKPFMFPLMGGVLLCAGGSALSLPGMVPANLGRVVQSVHIVGLLLIGASFLGWSTEIAQASDRALDRIDAAANAAPDPAAIEASPIVKDLRHQVAEKQKDVTYLNKMQHNLMKTIPGQVLLLTDALRVLETNQQFRSYFKLLPDEERDQTLETLIPNKELLRAVRESIGSPGIKEIQFQHYVKKAGDRHLKAWICGEQRELIILIIEETVSLSDSQQRLPKTQIINLQSEKLQLAGGVLEEMMESLNPLVNELSAKAQGLATRADIAADVRGELANLHGSGKAISRILKTYQSFAEKHLEKMEEVNVVTTIEEALDPKNYPIDVTKVQLTREFGLKRPKIEGSRVQLKQAVVNLVTNAIEATQLTDRPPQIEIHVLEDAGKVEIAVVDNGAGLAQENLAKALRGEYSKKHESGGMGLSVTRRIVYGHRGNLVAESREGEGSVFTLQLPAKS